MEQGSTSPYEQSKKQSKLFKQRMRNGTGIHRILTAENAPTHHIDALDRFRKDYSIFDKDKREEEKIKRQQELQRKKIQHMQRQSKRWFVMEEEEQAKVTKMNKNLEDVLMGKKRTGTSNGLPYNPISLVYDKNPEGQRLKLKDDDHKVRGLVRAHNIENHGNSKFNPLNGFQRGGIDSLVPENLNSKYQQRVNEFEDNRRIKLPQTSENTRKNIFNYY